MKPLATITGMLLLIISSCGRVEIDPAITFELSNTLNGYEYEVSVTEQNLQANTANNVFFVLDADVLIPIILQEYESLGSTQPLTIVGISSQESGKRVRDYSPTEIGSEESGEADDFFQFIELQVIPELTSRQVMDSTSKRTIVGHSMGGLATCYAFIAHNAVFDNYIALSPSLFWDDFIFFQLEDSARQAVSQEEKSVFVGVGENEDFGIANGYSQWTETIDNHYPNVRLEAMKVSGSHYGSRDELLRASLNFVLQ